MRNRFNINESEKNRIRNLHKKVLVEQYGKPLLAEQTGSDAGDYHMWENCAGGQVVALTDDQTMTANGQSCHNAANQNPTNPGIVLACTQALVTAFGTGPVLQWNTGQQGIKSCWKYLGTQFFNNVPTTSSPSYQGGSGGATPTTLQSCSQCTGSGGELAWICADVGGGQGGTGCYQAPCPYGNQATNPTMWNTGGGCWTNQQDCNNGGLNAASGSNNPCGGYGGTEHECTPNGCVPWAGGQYPNLTTCQQNCSGGGTEYCIDCAAQIMNYVPNNITCPTCTSCNQLPGGNWTSLGNNPNPSPPPCWECQNPGSPCIQSWAGTENSQSDCQANCSPSDWECVAPGNCQQTANGTFPTQAACLASPGCQTTQTLDCDTGAPYTQAQWATMSDPNTGWYAVCDGHEANSNCNWICNKVTALASFTSPGGTLSLDRKYCKLQHVQAAANNVPCGNCSTVATAPCLSTTFTDSRIDHFNNQGGMTQGCYGTNGTQANPHPNSFCGKKAQFCGMSNPSTMQQAKCDWLSGTYVWPSSCPPPTPQAPACPC